MELFTSLFLAALAASLITQLWLARRHQSNISNHRDAVPAAFADRVSLDDHQKAADYTIAKIKLDRIDLIYGVLLLLAWTLGGGLEWLDNLWRSANVSPLVTGISFILSATIIMSLLDLPFSLYSTFVIEERFGFNRSTYAVFFSDMLKQAILMLVIGTPLIATALWIMASAGSLWWFYVWAVWIGFTLFMFWAYPAVIAPLFNKFTPLDDESLQQRIQTLLDKCGFKSKGIFVMDGSKRSGHGNAYFTGFGQNKRIVFFDTLLESLNPEEIEAVLAHELGHFKRKHIQQRLLLTAAMSMAALALLGWLSQQSWFYTNLGVPVKSDYMALMLFMMVMPVFTFYLSPLMAGLSRKHEFEADTYAVMQSDGNDLIRALVKMYKENASTLTPDPLYSAFHDSHPPAPLRIRQISGTIDKLSSNITHGKPT